MSLSSFHLRNPSGISGCHIKSTHSNVARDIQGKRPLLHLHGAADGLVALGREQRCHQAPGRSLASHLDDLHSVLHGGLPAACAGAFHVVVWCLPACHTTAQPYALVSRESEFYSLYPRFYLGTEMEFGSPHGPPFCHLSSLGAAMGNPGSPALRMV